MTVLWADGFDHYGNDREKMLDGIYASAHGGVISSAQAATGVSSFFHNAFDANNQIVGPRFVLPDPPYTKMGVMMRVYFPSLPNTDAGAMICDFVSQTSTRSQLVATLDGNGAIRFYRGYGYQFNGSNGTLVATTDPVITAAGWHHIEIQVNIHDTTGWVRVAVNSAHEYEATGLDTAYDSSGIYSVAHHNGYYTTTAGLNQKDWYMDDVIYYDFTGSSAVETDFCPPVDGNGVATAYITELQCRYLPPNGNTAEDDWTKSTGASAFALVDEGVGAGSPVNDADYIQSATAGDLTELDLEDLPPEITYIRGLLLLNRMSKIDAGYAETQLGMKSVAATHDNTARPITVAPTYWWDFNNIDPNSGARWTRTSLNAGKYRLTRNV